MDPPALEVDRSHDGRSVLLSNEIQICRTLDFDRQTAVVRSAKCSPDSAICLEPDAGSKRISLILCDWKRSGCTNCLVSIVAKKQTSGNRKSSSRNHIGITQIA